MNEQKKEVPDLRFKGFTNDWEQCKFEKALVNKVGLRRGPFGSALRKDSFVPESDQAYAVYEQRNAINNVFNARYYISKEKYDDLGNFHLKPNDIIMSGAGTIGKLAKVPQDFRPGVFNQALIRLRVTSNINVDYFLEFMNTPDMQQRLTGSNPGSAMVNLVPMKELKSWIIQLPNYNEQRAIANLLKLVNNFIDLQQRKLDLLKQLKKGLLQKMFADKGSKRPILRFNGFTDDWEQRKVSDIFTVTRGQVLATTKISEVKTNEMCFPVYSSQTKNNGLMGYYNKYLFNTAITWTTDGANAGTVNYREGKFYSTNVNGVLLSDDGYANKAIAEILDRVAWRHVSRVGNPKLMNNVMSNIKISIPSSFEEQNAISEFLTKFDHLIALQQRKQNHLKLLKKSLLQQMFM